MKRVTYILLVLVACLLFAACDTQATAQPINSVTATTVPKIATVKPTIQATVKPTIQPTTKPIVQATNEPTIGVCNAHVTNTPCRTHATLQDAITGLTHSNNNPSGDGKASINNGIVSLVYDDSNYVNPVSHDGLTQTLIKMDMENVQYTAWYWQSTTNADGSTTYVKSDYTEVDVTIFYDGKIVATSKLTSETVDKLITNGQWNTADENDTWNKYDSAYIDASLPVGL